MVEDTYGKTYTWRGHTDNGNIYTKRHIYRGTYKRMDTHGWIYARREHIHKMDKGYTYGKTYI